MRIKAINQGDGNMTTDVGTATPLAKCEFGRAMVTYLGRQVENGQVWPVEAKMNAIISFPDLTTWLEVYTSLGSLSGHNTPKVKINKLINKTNK